MRPEGTTGLQTVTMIQLAAVSTPKYPYQRRKGKCLSKKKGLGDTKGYFSSLSLNYLLAQSS